MDDLLMADLGGDEMTRQMQGLRVHKTERGECVYCDRERKRRNDFHPSHEPMGSCRSGGRNHCTCDTCF
jgi:hypothetical protein